MDEVKKVQKKKLNLPVMAVGFFLLGALSLIIIRFVTLQDTSVHYHANFALYVNGQKDEFKSFTFYEEIQSCTAYDSANVKLKGHLHDENPGLIHVEQSGATWGQFFANLGYGLSNKAVTTDKGVFADDQDGNQLTFIVNGQPVSSIANEVIKNEDVLLVNYGKEDNETIQTRADSIPRDAHEANAKNDPAACSGSQTLSFTDRLKSAIGINQPTASH
jgi:hypothetical protein